MKKTLCLCIGMGLSISMASGLLAQAAAPPGPPKVIQIFREEVKPGKGPAHEKWETGWPRAYGKAKWPTNYLAIVSMTGPSEAWFLSGYESFAAWGKNQVDMDKSTLKADDDRLSQGDGEFLSSARSIVAAYREDLSSKTMVNLPTMRYFRIVTYRVRPGHDSDFTDTAKIIKATYEKTGMDVSWSVYQIASGMPGPTYLVFLPMKSLDEVDSFLAHSKANQDAMGEENTKKMGKLASDGYLSVESNLFAFNPKISYPSKEWIAADPFWAPAPAVAAKKESAKAAPKP